MIITTDNYEEYFYQYCEGGLTDKERAIVEAFAAQHPKLAEGRSSVAVGCRSLCGSGADWRRLSDVA